MRLDDLTVQELLSQIAAKTPAPGGGAVAPVVMALGAALGQMVLRFSEGKKSLAGHEELHREAIAAMEKFSNNALDLAEQDANAYSALNALWKLERDDPARKAQWADAVAAAIDAPMRVLVACNELLEMLDRLVGKTNKMLGSDLAIAAVLAEAAARAAAWNVRINLPLLDDDDIVQRMRSDLTSAVSDAIDACSAVEDRIATP